MEKLVISNIIAVWVALLANKQIAGIEISVIGNTPWKHNKMFFCSCIEAKVVIVDKLYSTYHLHIIVVKW